MREPCGFFPESFNNLNNSNSAWDSLLNLQAQLRDLHIVASKGGRVETNGEAEGRRAQTSHGCRRGEESGCGWCFLQPGGAEGHGEHSCRSERAELQLIQRPGQDAALGSSAGVWQLEFKTEKQSHGVRHPKTLRTPLPSPLVLDVKLIIHKPDWSRLGLKGAFAEVQGCHYWEGKTKKAAGFPQPTPFPCITAVLMAARATAGGQHSDFTELKKTCDSLPPTRK